MLCRRTAQIIILLVIVSGLTSAYSPLLALKVNAQSAAELQEKINVRNSEIEALEREIIEYQRQVNTISKEADSLKNAIASLDLSQKKITANLKITENKISNANLEIKKLGFDISDKSESIKKNRVAIADTFRKLYEIDSQSLVASFLMNNTISDFLIEADNLAQYQHKAQEHVTYTETIKQDLELTKTQKEKIMKELVVLKQELADENKALSVAKNEKNNLLKDTQNTEANYKKILDQRIAQKEQFERELLAFESQLKIAIDPTSIPKSSPGVLAWPVDNVFITQYFGNTEFSTKNPQIYNGKGHTGMDFRASIGTRVKAAASGVVIGTGDTDLIRGCYSYGKWIMIKHPNGLSTLYSHLSVISINEGAQVIKGQTIGYSGNTGYSTGPHLHFGVYASQGVKITQFSTSINCKSAIIPLADPKAYLNPLSYLPTF